MGDLDKLWSISGSKRLKTDQLLPVYIVQTIIRRSIGRVQMYAASKISGT